MSIMFVSPRLALCCVAEGKLSSGSQQMNPILSVAKNIGALTAVNLLARDTQPQWRYPVSPSLQQIWAFPLA